MKPGLLPTAVSSSQYDPFVTRRVENKTKHVSHGRFCLLYLSECRVEILVWPLLFILYPATFFFFFAIFTSLLLFSSSFLFLFFNREVAAAASFLPEQFFVELFTSRLAALTLCFGSISRGDILPVPAVFSRFALLLSPQITFSCNKLHCSAS